MTAAASAASAPVLEPPTVRAFLLGPDPEHSAEVLAESLHEHETTAGLLPPVRGLTSAVDRAVEAELAGAVDGFLELDLFALLAHGWAKHSELRAAAHRTRGSRGSEEIVPLATHTVTSAHHPSVDVLVDGAPVTTVAVDLTVVFRIRALVAVVQDARLTALHSGECGVEAKLAVRGVDVATRQGRLNLPLGRRLRSPIELLPPRAAPPPPPPPYPPGPPAPPGHLGAG